MLININNQKIYSSKDVENLPKKTAEEKNIASFLYNWFNNNKTYITSKTSGSTGKPKTITLPKQAVLKSAELTCSFFNLKQNNIALLCLPINFIAGKLMVVRAIYSKLNLLTTPPTRNPLKNIISVIDFAAMTPMQVKTILLENPEKLNLIKTLIIGGATVSEKLSKELKKYKTNCYATFGMTETITHIALKKINNQNYYKALSTISFETTEDNCLIITAPHLQKKIKTNDIVKLISKTKFIWLGRKDNVINTGSIKVQAEELEKKLLDIIPNLRFFIASKKDEILGDKIILIIESSTKPDLNFSGLNKYEIPKNVYILNKFVETKTGKIMRSETKKLIDL